MKIRSALFNISLTALACSNCWGQQMNKSGHFSQANTPDSYTSSKSGEVQIEKFIFKGNSAFKTQKGFVTLSGNDENSSSTLRIYSDKGKELFSQAFIQTLNFMLSPAKKFCAFHDSKQICVINLNNNTLTTFPGSNVFAVNDLGEVAYYDNTFSTIHFKNKIASINDPVYSVLFFKESPLFITWANILQLGNESTETVYTTAEGRVFDAAIFNDKLYFSVKKEKTDAFIFTSFSTSDLNTFKPEEEVLYPLKGHTKKKTEEVNSRQQSNTLLNEMIPDPLYYYNNVVYQPVGNSYDEIQEYSPGDIYPHPGVDLLGTYMQDVYSVKKGYVKAILTTSAQYHWRIAIANQNTSNYSQGYLYAHLEQTSMPYAVGDSVNAGDVIGYLVNFPVTGFVHCHFARIACQGSTWNGDWWTFDNPLSYMSNFFDSIPPEFEKTINNDEFAFRDANGNYLSPDSLYGNVKVISKVYDRINSNWHCDVNKLRYNVSLLASPQTLLLDSLSYEYDFFNDYYFGGSYYMGLLHTIYSRDVDCFSTGDYTFRDFYHIVTNSDGNDSISGVDSLQFFNTLSLPDNSYIFRVIASDPSGNTTTDSMIVKIKNSNLGVNNLSENSQIHIFPNPVSEQLNIDFYDFHENTSIRIFNAQGKEMESFPAVNSNGTINISTWPVGLYNVVVNFNGDLKTVKAIKY